MRPREIRIRVAVCIVDGERILLVRHLKNGRHYWLVPGGGVEYGETLAGAAIRELREETGYDVEPGRLLLVCESVEPGGRHLLNLVFAGAIRGGSLEPGRDGRLVGAGWAPLDELATLEMYPAIGPELLSTLREGPDAAVRVLGNVWCDEAGR